MDLKTLARLQTNGELIARFTAAVQRAAVDILKADKPEAAHLAWAIRANFKLLENRSQEYGQMILRSAIIENPKFSAQLEQLPEDKWGEVGLDSDVLEIVNVYVERFAANNI